ncbi:MAG: hypothetical protein AB2L20_11880 [Mangrovibacterium sp.]
MNEYYNIKRLALILAVQAEIESMKVENLVREQNGMSPAFNEAFLDKACELRNLAYATDEQL